MAFTRVKALGWAANEILTSAQMNALDINVSNAVDGSAAGSYLADIEWTGDHTWNGGSIFFEESSSDSTIKKNDETGTGSADGGALTIEGSAGQAQTGSNDNTRGGDIEHKPGVAGTGGSGLDGTPGMTVLYDSGIQVTSKGWVYEFCFAFDDITPSSTTTFLLPADLIPDSGSENVTYVVAELVAEGGGPVAHVKDHAFIFSASEANLSELEGHENGAWAASGRPTMAFAVNAGTLELDITEGSGGDVSGVVYVKAIKLHGDSP